ncbi:S8 family serine peptidase [Methanococcoides sp. FTZ1]|uniref:S8 family serine peptidase n=1 Tax=Methanococcoides sp. FTZ1 TaxID=3439061 RepID=UPI003F82590E
MRNTIPILVSMLILLSLMIIPSAAAQSDNEKVPVIIGFKDKPDAALVKAFGGDVKQEYTIIPAISADIPVKALYGLSMNPNIEYVEYDAEVHAMEQTTPWGIERIGAPVVHSTYTGDGVKVAIIDTGIDYNHPDLNASYAGGYDYVNKDYDPMDDRGHGTHVAGTVAAVNNEFGVIGAAPDAELYAVKVLDSDGSGSYTNVISGVQWAADNEMDVASMSLGGGLNSISLKRACNNAYEQGVVLVASAGNSYGGRVSYPAAYDSVIAVSATDEDDTIAYFSSIGLQVELAAPGVNVNSTVPDNKYDYKDGTSMAAPHVTGTVALLLNTNIHTDYDANGDSSWDPAEVRERLHDTATDMGDSGKDIYYGYGLVNASAAVDFGATEPYPEPYPEPPSGGNMHIANIVMGTGTKAAGPSNVFVWATATVIVVNEAGSPVPDATVSGTWSELTSDSDTGITGADGIVTLRSDSVKNPGSGGTFNFTVTGVACDGWFWDVDNSTIFNSTDVPN